MGVSGRRCRRCLGFTAPPPPPTSRHFAPSARSSSSPSLTTQPEKRIDSTVDELPSRGEADKIKIEAWIEWIAWGMDRRQGESSGEELSGEWIAYSRAAVTVASDAGVRDGV